MPSARLSHGVFGRLADRQSCVAPFPTNAMIDDLPPGHRTAAPPTTMQHGLCEAHTLNTLMHSPQGDWISFELHRVLGAGAWLGIRGYQSNGFATHPPHPVSSPRHAVPLVRPSSRPLLRSRHGLPVQRPEPRTQRCGPRLLRSRPGSRAPSSKRESGSLSASPGHRQRCSLDRPTDVRIRPGRLGFCSGPEPRNGDDESEPGRARDSFHETATRCHLNSTSGFRRRHLPPRHSARPFGCYEGRPPFDRDQMTGGRPGTTLTLRNGPCSGPDRKTPRRRPDQPCDGPRIPTGEGVPSPFPLCSVLGDPLGPPSGLQSSSLTVWVFSSNHQPVFGSVLRRGTLAVAAVQVLHVDVLLFVYLLFFRIGLTGACNLIRDLSFHLKVGGILRKSSDWNGATATSGACQFSVLLVLVRRYGVLTSVSGS